MSYRNISSYGCSACFLPLKEGHSCFVIETVKKRLAVKDDDFVLVQVRKPVQVLLCKSCFEQM